MKGLFKKRLKASEELEASDIVKRGTKLLGAMDLYMRLLVDKITHGGMDVPPRVLSDGEFYYSTNRIFTRNGVKKMFFVRDLPDEISRGFVTDLREAVAKEVYNYNTTNGTDFNVSVTLLIDGVFYPLDFSNKRTQARWNNFVRQHARVSKEAKNRTLKDELNTDKYGAAVVRKVKSFLYLKEAKDEQNAAFFKTKIIFELVADNDEILEVAERTFRAFTYRYRIQHKEVFIQTNEYQKAYSPAGRPAKSLLRQMNEGDVYADDTITSLTVTTHGKVGDDVGVYHGIDIQSRDVVAFDMYSGTDAKNVLLTAGSGEGKSNYSKMLDTFYMIDLLFSTVVFDYEGTEYKGLAYIGDAKIIGMGSAEGRYVNTMVIGDLTGDEELDAELKINAIESTERVFNLLVDENYGMEPEQLAIFSDALGEVYADAGVTEERDSWKNSKGLTYFHIYSKIVEMTVGKHAKKYIEVHTAERLKNFRAILRPYFEEGGSRKHWFSKPIDIPEIMESRHIVFNFAMGATDESSVDGKALALRQMFASHLTLMKAAQNRVQGIKTVTFIEELQRYLKQRYSGDIVANFASAGRKLGLINYFITNAPSSMLISAESGATPLDKNIGTIMSNITMVIIGALYRSDMAALAEYFSLHDSLGYLNELADVKENNSEDATLKHCFYVKYRGQAAIVKMMSHPQLEDLPLYKTVNNTYNPNLRTSEFTTGADVQDKVTSAFIQDGEWDKMNVSYEDRVKGSQVFKTWERTKVHK